MEREVEKEGGGEPPPSNIGYWMVRGSYMRVASSKDLVARHLSSISPSSPQIYKCDNERCPRPDCYRSCSSNKEDVFKCERPKCDGYFRLLR